MDNKDEIIDFISGNKVKAKQEEVNAVQVLSKRLVKEYEYDKSHSKGRGAF